MTFSTQYPNARSGFNTDLQALRGLAIFFVMYYHFVEMVPGLKQSIGMVGNLVFGGQGVDLFFVISGYVITKSMYRHIDHPGRVNFKDGLRFWMRRAYRTMPPAVIWLTVVLSITMYTGWYGSDDNNLMHAHAAAFQYANYYNVACSSQGTCGLFSYYWSLSLEEQFYLFLPIAMLVMTRRQLSLFMLLGGIVAALVFTKSAFLLHLPIDFSLLQPFRTDGLMFGVALALFEPGKTMIAIKKFLKKNSVFSFLLCLIAHIVLWTRGSSLPFFAFNAYISPGTVSAILVLVAISAPGRVIPGNAIRRFFVFLGNISFSLYLSHVIIIYSFQNYMGMHGFNLPNGFGYVPYALMVFITVAVVSKISYALIEAPFQKLGRKLSDGKTFSRLASSEPELPVTAAEPVATQGKPGKP